MKASPNVNPAIGWISGTISGTSTATTRLISTVYVTTPAILPPSLPVTTAQAVAVGQIRHSIAASTPARAGTAGHRISTSASPTNVSDCTSSSQPIQRCGRICCGSILQKLRKSIAKSSRGCSSLTMLSSTGPALCSAGMA